MSLFFLIFFILLAMALAWLGNELYKTYIVSIGATIFEKLTSMVTTNPLLNITGIVIFILGFILDLKLLLIAFEE